MRRTESLKLDIKRKYMVHGTSVEKYAEINDDEVARVMDLKIRATVLNNTKL